MDEWLDALKVKQKALRFKNKTKHVRLFQTIITHASTRPAVPPPDEEVATLKPPPDFIAKYPERLFGVMLMTPAMVTRMNVLVLAAGCTLIVWQGRLALGLTTGSFSFAGMPIW